MAIVSNRRIPYAPFPQVVRQRFGNRLSLAPFGFAKKKPACIHENKS